MAQIEVGDVVRIGDGGRGYLATVTGVRLGRLVVERCDGLPARPVSARDVQAVFKPAGAPDRELPRADPLKPTAQLRLM